MNSFYLSQGAEIGPRLQVAFDGDEASLDIPKEGITLPSGWSLLPVIYPAKVITCSMYDCKSTPLLILLVSHTPRNFTFFLLSGEPKECGQLPAWSYYPLLPD